MSEKSEKGLLPRQLEVCRVNRCLLLLSCGKVSQSVSQSVRVSVFYLCITSSTVQSHRYARVVRVCPCTSARSARM